MIVSFDVSSLYTNVSVREAIDSCADLLYSGKHKIQFMLSLASTTSPILSSVHAALTQLTQFISYGHHFGPIPTPVFSNPGQGTL